MKICEQKCHLTVWVFRGCLKSLYCPQCKRYMSCVCGLGFGGGSKILMGKKIPSALTHLVLLRRNKTTETFEASKRTPQSCLFQPHSPLYPQDSMHCGGARPQSPTTEHPERGSCFDLTHHFLSHPPIHSTPDTCKQKGQPL